MVHRIASLTEIILSLADQSQVMAGDEVHDDEIGAAGRATQSMNGDDVRVMQVGDCSRRLAAEAN